MTDLELLEAAFENGERLPDETIEEEQEIVEEPAIEEKLKPESPTEDILLGAAKIVKRQFKAIPETTKNNIASFENTEQFKNRLLELLKDKEIDLDEDLSKLVNAWNKTTVTQLTQVLVFDTLIRKVFNNNKGISKYLKDTLYEWDDKYRKFIDELNTIKAKKLNEGISDIEKIHNDILGKCGEIQEYIKEMAQHEIFLEEKNLVFVDKIEEKIKSSLGKSYFNKKASSLISIYEEKTKAKLKQIVIVFSALLLVSIVGVSLAPKIKTQQTQQIGKTK